MSTRKSPLQEAFVDYVASIQPTIDRGTAAELDEVRQAIDTAGKWQKQDEWRISTYFDCEIRSEEIDGKQWLIVRVECDGQEFKARCPALEKAYLVSRFYQRIIIDQFYSVGPPWA